MLNDLPADVLRIVFDTRQDPPAQVTLDLAAGILTDLRSLEGVRRSTFVGIDHIGRGSTVAQFVLANLDVGISLASIAVGLAGLWGSGRGNRKVTQVINNYGAETVIISAGGMNDPIVLQRDKIMDPTAPRGASSERTGNATTHSSGLVTHKFRGHYVNWNREFVTEDRGSISIDNATPSRLGDTLLVEAYATGRHTQSGLPIFVAVTTRPIKT